METKMEIKFAGYSPKFALITDLFRTVNDPSETAERKQVAQAEIERRQAASIAAVKVIMNNIGSC
jgi:hypothetical protein